MDRKQFIKKSVHLGMGSGALLLWGAPGKSPAAHAAQTAEGTSCEKKQDFAQAWVKRLMETMDSQLDAAARTKLMEACGRACFRASHGEAKEAKPQPDDFDKLPARLREFAGKDGVRREGNAVYFSYGTSGRCYCPLVESAPPILPATYCNCSVGYVKEMFERALGKPVKVELTESIKRGGKACRFTVEV
jgi:hypothetical protein